MSPPPSLVCCLCLISKGARPSICLTLYTTTRTPHFKPAASDTSERRIHESFERVGWTRSPPCAALTSPGTMRRRRMHLKRGELHVVEHLDELRAEQHVATQRLEAHHLAKHGAVRQRRRVVTRCLLPPSAESVRRSVSFSTSPQRAFQRAPCVLKTQPVGDESHPFSIFFVLPL